MPQTWFVNSRCQPGHVPPKALGRILPASGGPRCLCSLACDNITHTSLPSSRGLLSVPASKSPPSSCKDTSHGYPNYICKDPISQKVTFCTFGWTWIWGMLFNSPPSGWEECPLSTLVHRAAQERRFLFKPKTESRPGCC